jgi:hypothetical protein
MFTKYFPLPSIWRHFLRILAPLAAGVALLALPSQAWGVYNFTVSNNSFPASGAPPAVGSSINQTVIVTLNSGSASVAIQSIVFQSAGATVSGVPEYVINSIDGCATNGTPNPSGTACNIHVTYKPAYPGSLASPLLSRNATLVITDGNGTKWPFGLAGAATGPLTQLVPGTISLYAGLADTTDGAAALNNGLDTAATTGDSGDGGPATSAKIEIYTAGVLYQPLALDSAGNLYFVDTDHIVIRKIDNTSQHNITTVAGTKGSSSLSGTSGDGGLATSASLSNLYAMTLDSAGNIYFLDSGGQDTLHAGTYMVLRRIDAATGLLSSVAGQNYNGSSYSGSGTCPTAYQQLAATYECGDGGPAANADLLSINDLAIDQSGNIYLWSGQGASLRVINATTGIISTVANSASTSLNAYLVGATTSDMTLAADGNFYVIVQDATTKYYVLRQVNPSSQAVAYIAGNINGTTAKCVAPATGQAGYSLSKLFLTDLENLSSDASGNIYLTGSGCGSYSDQTIYRINLATSTAYEIEYSNSWKYYAAPAVFNAFNGYDVIPIAAIPDNAGNIYFANGNNAAQIALLSGSNSALYFPYTPPGNTGYQLQDFTTSADQSVAFVNVGNANYTMPDFSLASTDTTTGTNFALDPTSPSGSCVASATLNPGAICSFDLQFTPVVAGVVPTDTLNIGSPAAQTVTLNGTGIANPQLQITSPTASLTSTLTWTMNFPTTSWNTSSAPQTIIFTNPGTAPLWISGFNIGKLGDFAIANTTGSTACIYNSSTLEYDIAAGSSCTLQVTFNPVPYFTQTNFTVSIQITDNVYPTTPSGIAATITFNGTGQTAPPAATLALQSQNNPSTTEGTTAQITATLSQTSTAANATLSISGITITGTNAANFTIDSSGTCNGIANIVGLGSCTIVVDFKPPSNGPYTATLSVADNASGSPQTLTLNGTGTPAALTPQTITFGTIAAQTVGTPLTLSASASSGLTVAFNSTTTGVCTVSGTQATFLTTGTCTIDANQSGNSTYSAAPLVPQSFTVNAAPATAPAVSISPTSYVFPATTVNSGYQSGNGNPAITLTNTGTAPLTFTGSKPFTITNAGTSSPFSVYPNGSCTGTYVNFSTPLPATGNCTITVQFYPQKAGVYAATLSVADNAANSPQTTTTLSGIGKAGQLQFAPAQLNAFAGAIGSANACADTGNGSAATSAQLCKPSATAADMNGNIYIADPGKNVVRMVNSAGNISYFAGNSPATCAATSSNIGDGCAAINATLNNPTAVAVDGFGNVYISDTGNYRVRVVNAVTGIISTYAGNGTTGSFVNNTPATSVPIVPNGIAFDPWGDLYIADAAQNIVIEVGGTPAYAIVFAGIAPSTNSYQIALNAPMSVAADLNGDLYIADTGNNLVRGLIPSGDGYNITIVAGTGTAGNTGDNGPATSAEIYANGVAVDAAGDVYISSGTLIRKVNLAGTITTLAGGGGPGTLPAQATSVGLTSVGFPGIDLAGDLLIPSGTGVAIAGPQGNLVFGSQTENTTSAAQVVTITNTGNSSVIFYNPNNSSAVPGAPGRAAATAEASSGAAHPESGTGSGGGVYSITGDFAIASGGTCDFSSIAAGASCTINVTFSPTILGWQQGNITLYAEGPYTIPAVINLSGTGTSAALIAQTINFTQPTTPVTYSSGLTIPLVATGGASGNSVVFTIDTSSTGTGSITGSTLNVTGVGTFIIDANQAGNSTYSAATQVQKSVVVTKAAQTINFTQPTTPVTYSSGLTIPLVATGGASGNSVVFTIDTSSTGTGSITGTTLNVTGVGTFVIDANQSGNSTYSAATQVQKSVVVNAAPVPTFAVASPTAPQTVQPGGAANYTINVSPVNGSYPGTVTLSASGLPTGATASFVPPSVTPGSAGATSTLTIQTAAQTASAKSSVWPLAAPALGLIGLFFVPGKRRRRWLTLAVLLIASLGALTALSACGGGFQLPGSAATPHTITVNGANSSGAIVSSTTVQLTVQ